jgi:hypothetical protein
MVTFVTTFERYTAPELALEDDIPFMHQRIAEIGLHATHRNAGVQCERAQRISTAKPPGMKSQLRH